MKIYHLSHTDLDGYSCQYITKFYFNDIKFYNSNYGKEINDNFSMIINDIKQVKKDNVNEKFLILITDLNLTITQCEEFEKNSKELDVKLLLLDHHQSGEECMKKFSWYLLDNSRCATKITYDFFSKAINKNEKLSKFVDVVNAIDIWLSDDKNFELGKVFLGLIANAKEINKVMFKNEYLKYVFFLLDKAISYIGKENSNILLDDDTHILKKNFFKKNKNNTLANLISEFIVERLSAYKDKFSVYYENHKGILTLNIGNTSVIGNDFLTKNNDFDFFVDISSKKTLSFRANNKVDVSLMAKKLVGGGGHKNASGGLFASYKDSSNYDNAKAQFIDLINKKTTKDNKNV